MRIIFLTLLTLFAAFPVFAADTPMVTDWLKPVESNKVCMVNNTVFDKEQITVAVNGKTYYGCCAMCKERLEKDAAQRTAIDPVSGKSVDKSEAVIGADTKGNAYYFENLDNLKKFVPELK